MGAKQSSSTSATSASSSSSSPSSSPAGDERCHISRLSSVEIQLLMQLLDIRTLVAAACCCARLLAEAQSPFAWGRMPLCTLSTTRLETLLPIAPRSLLRLVPLRLRWERSKTPLLQAQLPALLSSFNVIELEEKSGLDWALLQQVLTAPWASSQLRSLSVCSIPADPALFVDLVASLAKVEHLRLYSNFVRSEVYARLALMPSLTSLSIDVIHWAAGLSHADWRQPLRSLELRGGTLDAPHFRAALELPCLSSLEHLSLDGFKHTDMEGIQSSPEDIRAIFLHLRCLHSLKLNLVSPIDALLPHLVHLPQLRSLDIHCGPQREYDVDIVGSFNPSLLSLRQALEQNASLRVKLVVSPFQRHVHELVKDDTAPNSRTSQQWLQLWKQWRKLPRVELSE